MYNNELKKRWWTGETTRSVDSVSGIEKLHDQKIFGVNARPVSHAYSLYALIRDSESFLLIVSSSRLSVCSTTFTTARCTALVHIVLSLAQPCVGRASHSESFEQTLADMESDLPLNLGSLTTFRRTSRSCELSPFKLCVPFCYIDFAHHNLRLQCIAMTSHGKPCHQMITSSCLLN